MVKSIVSLLIVLFLTGCDDYTITGPPPYQSDKIEGYFINNSEIEFGLTSGQIKVHSRIVSRFETDDDKGNIKYEKHI